MKFYIASGLEGSARVSEVAHALREAGHDHTYDWTKHGAVGDLGYARIQEVAHAETEGVRKAEVVIAILPGGRGTHVEIGMGIALRKRVLIFGRVEDFEASRKTCAFYHHDGCEWFVEQDPKVIAQVVLRRFKSMFAVVSA